MNTKKKENVLLVIDAQNDFCDPKGALPVTGADRDMERLSKFILGNIDNLDHIMLTQDSHRPVDIAHVTWWKDQNGNQVNPFQQITLADMDAGRFTPNFDPIWSRQYLETLEKQGEYPHIAWPIHCEIGTWGHNFYPILHDAVNAWAVKKGGINGVEMVTKGTNPRTEHFGAFHAQVQIPNAPETQPAINLLSKLQEYRNVYLAGEAKSHCVGSSLKQMLNLVPDLASKLIVLEDCMSDVAITPGLADPIFDRARSMGTRFADSTMPFGTYKSLVNA
jgi:nicotinamidase-related amidase